MQNLLRSFSLVLLFSTLSVGVETIIAQCPGAATCETAKVMCWDDLNGFSCTTTQLGAQNCYGNCYPTGTHPNSRDWYAFVSPGGIVTITLNVGACVGWWFLTMGIWGDCNCVEEISCEILHVPTNSSQTYQVELEPCKVYYITLDGGIPAGHCDFTLNTSGGNFCERHDMPRTVCKGTVWHSNHINSSGVYRERYSDAYFCPYDSVVEYIVRPDPIPPNVYFLTCDNKPYVDIFGRSYIPCRNHFQVNLPNTTDPFKCDSSILLTVVNVDFNANWKIQCDNGKVEIIPNVTMVNPCNAGESYQFNYSWYKKNDPNKTLISSDDILRVDAVNEDYYLEVEVRAELFTEVVICTKTFYESLNEGDWASKCFLLKGDPMICVGSNGSYSIDSFVTQPVKTYNWAINGGKILSKADSSSIIVKWNLKSDDTGTVCVFYNTDCDTSCKKCLNVLMLSSSNPDAGPNDSICDLAYTFKGKKDAGGYWSQISGPGHSSFSDTTDPTSKVLVDKYGVYRYVYYESLFGCSSTDTVDLYFNSKPDSTGLTYLCNSQLTQYKLQFLITGGTPPYTIIQGNGTIDNNNYFNSNLYENLTNYTIVIQDVMGCFLNFDFSHDCKCTNAIGALGKNLENMCEDQNFTLKYNTTTQKLDLGDTVIYIVTTDPDIKNAAGGTFIKLLTSNTVVYDASYINFNTTYYIFVLIGKKNGKGGIDFLADCVQVDGPKPFIFFANSIPQMLAYTSCDSFVFNSKTYFQTGIYSQKMINSNGCDSTLNIDLTISKSNLINYKLTSCDSALINGLWYLQSGNYIQTLKNANQCDSTLNIDLNITKSTSGDTLFRSCDSVIINGVTYRQTGIYKQTLINSIQCDSILIIDFTRLSKSSTALNYKSCDSVVVNNQVYKQTGSYTQILANANQCDSVLNMDVIITKSNSSNSILSACDSVKVNGQSYYQSGNYVQRLTNADLCDSVLLLNVTIHKSTKIDYILKGCDSATLNKRVYTLTGDYKQILTNVNGCDSMMNLHVIIDTNTHAQLALTHCDSLVVNKQVYTLTGVYKQLLTNTNGCDSTLILDLVIKPGNPSTLDAGADTSICEGEIIKLNGIFSGQANFFWHSANGSFDNPNNLTTNYYANAIGDERIYLEAADDCKQWSDSMAIHILPKQIVQVTGDTILNPCKEISFTASGGTNYTWTPSSFIECLDPPCSRVLLKSSSVTRFTISSSGPCVVPANLNLSLSKIQTDVYLPNVFSPNGDNINDVFLPVFNCEQVDYYNLQIFDRWGNLVFESLNKEKGWNGKYQDVKMGPGVYAYVVQYELHGAARKVKAGDVTLIR